MLAAAPHANAVDSLTGRDYATIRQLLHRSCGVELGPEKQPLVYGRLRSRLEALKCDSFEAYVQYILDPGHAEEKRLAIELLTTNETYFYREPKQFATLIEHARQVAMQRGAFDVWSAASSSGEEAYTLAMLLQAETDGGLPLTWRMLGSDISSRMLDLARRGVYPEQRLSQLPEVLKRRYCRRGTGTATGTALVDKELRTKLQWQVINLIEPLPAVGPFDAIFLRNVLIYFDRPTKQKVLTALARAMRPDGLLFVGLADGVQGLTEGLRSVAQGVYALPGR